MNNCKTLVKLFVAHIQHGKEVFYKRNIGVLVFVPISKADICGILPDVSPTTVEAVLSKMVKEGQIKKIGQSKMTRYMKA